MFALSLITHMTQFGIFSVFKSFAETTKSQILSTFAVFNLFPVSSELSKKFLKSCRLNGCHCGKRNLAKSQRYCTHLHTVVLIDIVSTHCCSRWKWIDLLVLLLVSLSVMSGNSAQWGKALGSGRCATVPGALSATFSCWSAYEPRKDLNVALRWGGKKKLSLDSCVITVIFFMIMLRSRCGDWTLTDEKTIVVLWYEYILKVYCITGKL